MRSQKISIPATWKVTGNSEGVVSQKPNFSKESMRNFWGDGGGFKPKSLDRGMYFFLQEHNIESKID